jgi:hypothetical protein
VFTEPLPSSDMGGYLDRQESDVKNHVFFFKKKKKESSVNALLSVCVGLQSSNVRDWAAM